MEDIDRILKELDSLEVQEMIVLLRKLSFSDIIAISDYLGVHFAPSDSKGKLVQRIATNVENGRTMRIIGEAAKRNPELPYGYWIAPDGKIVGVYRNHMETLERFGEGQTDWEEVLGKGWVRLVNGRRSFIVEAFPEFIHKRWSDIRNLAIESGAPEMFIETPDHRWTELNISDLNGPPMLKPPQFRPLAIANPAKRWVRIGVVSSALGMQTQYCVRYIPRLGIGLHFRINHENYHETLIREDDVEEFTKRIRKELGEALPNPTPKGRIIKIFDEDLDYEFVLNVIRGKDFSTEGTYEVYLEGDLIGRIFRDTQQFGYAIWYEIKSPHPIWLGNTMNEAVKQLLDNHINKGANPIVSRLGS